jgi:hypothetical protein
MHKIIVLIMYIALVGFNLYADDGERLQNFGFTSQQAIALLNGERLDNLTNQFDGLSLFPKTSFSNQIYALIKKNKAKTFVEALYYVPSLTGASQLAFTNALLNVKSLDGLQYFSHSENRIKTLIYSVNVIPEVGSRDFIPSFRVNSVPLQLNFFFNQNDETFGSADYEALFKSDSTSGELALVISNSSVLRQSVLTVANKGGMHTYILAIPMNQGMLLYSLITNDKATPSIIRDRMNISLLNRLDALKGWVVNNYPYN